MDEIRDNHPEWRAVGWTEEEKTAFSRYTAERKLQKLLNDFHNRQTIDLNDYEDNSEESA